MGAAVGSLPLLTCTCNASSVSSFNKKVEVYPASPPLAFCEADSMTMTDFLNPSSTELAKLGFGFGRDVVSCGSVLLYGIVLHIFQRSWSDDWGPFSDVDTEF